MVTIQPLALFTSKLQTVENWVPALLVAGSV